MIPHDRTRFPPVDGMPFVRTALQHGWRQRFRRLAGTALKLACLIFLEKKIAKKVLINSSTAIFRRHRLYFYATAILTGLMDEESRLAGARLDIQARRIVALNVAPQGPPRRLQLASQLLSIIGIGLYYSLCTPSDGGVFFL